MDRVLSALPLQSKPTRSYNVPVLHVHPHPLLEIAAFEMRFPESLARTPSPDSLTERLTADAAAASGESDEERDRVRRAVRDLLRHGGYRPTGRGKPASEYLVRAAGDGKLGAINLAVDACNVASLESGLPISVVDLERASAPFEVRIAAEDATYVFNASGQEIKLAGLLCLCDAQGPCANAVKDSQRTKTSADTSRALAVVWGTREFQGRAERAAARYREWLAAAGAETSDVAIELS